MEEAIEFSLDGSAMVYPCVGFYAYESLSDRPVSKKNTARPRTERGVFQLRLLVYASRHPAVRHAGRIGTGVELGVTPSFKLLSIEDVRNRFQRIRLRYITLHMCDSDARSVC